MLRQHLSRSVIQGTKSASNAARTFATSSRRQAEVQLTIGMQNWSQKLGVRLSTDILNRWQAGFDRRYEFRDLKDSAQTLTLPQLVLP